MREEDDAQLKDAPLIVSLSHCAALSLSRCTSWLLYQLSLSSLVEINAIGNPDLG